MCLICVPLVESGIDSMVDKANRVECETVELRLDFLSGFSDLGHLEKIEKKKVVACMPSWEGGNFKGSEPDRMKILRSSLDFADFITIELNTDKILRDSLVAAAKDAGVKVILSYHNFDLTPPRQEIIRILNKELEANADIAKIAFMANNYTDVLNLMQVLVDQNDDASFNIPLIAISMGKFGKISRVIGPLLGSYLTYAPIEKGGESAPGQLTLDELTQILKILD